MEIVANEVLSSESEPQTRDTKCRQNGSRIHLKNAEHHNNADRGDSGRNNFDDDGRNHSGAHI